jgi:hypothetical protein
MSRVINHAEEPHSGLVQDWNNPTLEPVVSALTKNPLAMVALLSKRRGAKSHTLKCLIYELVKRRVVRMDSIVCISATSELNRAYDWLPQGAVMSNITEEKLGQLIDFQQDRVVSCQQRARRSGRAQSCRNLTLIFDDISGAIDLQRSPSFTWIALNGRHAKIGPVFILAQAVRALFGGPSIRSNIDMILAGTLSQSQQRSAWEITTDMSFKVYTQTLAAMPTHSFLAYSNFADTAEGRWSLVRAPADVPKFRLGRAPSKKERVQDKQEGWEAKWWRPCRWRSSQVERRSGCASGSHSQQHAELGLGGACEVVVVEDVKAWGAGVK